MMGLNGLIVILAGSDSLTRLTCQLLPASIKLYRDQANELVCCVFLALDVAHKLLLNIM